MRRSCWLYACVLLLLITGCRDNASRNIHPAFYYWKSDLRLTDDDTAALDSLATEKLYIRFFDVAWDKEQGRALPVAITRFSTTSPLPVIPVVFITNETFHHCLGSQADSLAFRVEMLLAQMSALNKLNIGDEIQLDCDWTAGTRASYFRFLESIRRTPFFEKRRISVTIRLHQLRFISSSGIPPADKGLLMCYNMGNLKKPETLNSIIDTETLRPYVRKMKNYPLKLDVALPLFDWWVWFRRGEYRGLIKTETLPPPVNNTKNKIFESDSLLKGYNFEKGDRLRYENCPLPVLLKTAALLKPMMNQGDINLILYHYDAKIIEKYTIHELETLYRSFR